MGIVREYNLSLFQSVGLCTHFATLLKITHMITEIYSYLKSRQPKRFKAGTQKKEPEVGRSLFHIQVIKYVKASVKSKNTESNFCRPNSLLCIYSKYCKAGETHFHLLVEG